MLSSFSCVQFRWFCLGIAAAVGLPLAAMAESPARDVKQAAELLPASIVAHLQVPAPATVLRKIVDHPLRDRLLALPAYDAMMKAGPVAKLQMVRSAFEARMDMTWDEALADLTAGGITVSLDASEGGVVVLVQAKSTTVLEQLREFILTMSRMQTRGGAAGIEQGEYRRFKVYAVGQLKMTVIDGWMLLTNKPHLGKVVIDNYLAAGDQTLASNERFIEAISSMASDDSQPSAWGFVDVQALRDAGLAADLFRGQTNHPLVEVLFGGIVQNLRHTGYATGKLAFDNAGLRLQVFAPHQAEWEPPRDYYFGSLPQRAAPPLLEVPNRLLAISAHRDLAQMWLRSGDLMTEKANEGLAKADSQLTTLFSGNDFGEDILGAFESDVQIVARPQQFDQELPQPAIKLPEFALQMRMVTPEKTQPELRRVFQSFIGFVNIVGAMKGQTQFDLGNETLDHGQLFTATYVPAIDEQNSLAAPINFNFSPTIGFVDNRFVLSSTAALARELVGAPKVAESGSRQDGTNTIARLNGESLQQLLVSNRDQLVAQQMLGKGLGKEAAEGEIGLLMALLSFVEAASIELNTSDHQLQLTAEVTLDD